VKGQRIQEWEVAHIAPACSNKVDKWIAEQPTTTPATTTPATASKGYGELNNIDEAFRLVGTGNKRRDSRLEKMQELLTELTKTVGIQNKQIVKLLEVVRFGETSNPVRPAADEDNKPVNCLGTKTNGQACKQTQNRLQPNGFCGQHQSQSGDSERAVLDNHSEEVTEAQQEDRPAVSSDTLELLG
jgi:hypothetical protein